MMRLVDADMFEESLKQAQNECRRKEGGNFLFGFLSKVRANLEKMPTVDAVPVVRCKDCKYKYYAYNRVPNERCWVCDKSGEDIENMEWFCPYGEKEVDK